MRGQQESERSVIAASNGLPARLEALSAIAGKNPIVEDEVWLFRLLFLSLDLLPVTMKLMRMLSLECSPYEEVCKADRRWDVAHALRLNSTAMVEERRIKEQARTDADVNRVRIRLDKERRIAEAYGAAAAAEGGQPMAQQTPDDTIDGWDLDRYVEEMTPHERRPVSVPPDLRRGGLVGLAALLAIAGLAGLWPAVFGISLKGAPIIFVCLAGVLVLLAYTRGFRHAPTWALHAIFASLLAGLLLPLIIVGMNL